MLNSLRLAVAFAALLLAAGCCSAPGPGEPSVTLIESGKTRLVPVAGFDEQRYLSQGYLKNTDAQGNPIYILIPASDAKKETAFMGGGPGGTERSWGGYEGQFTGKDGTP